MPLAPNRYIPHKLWDPAEKIVTKDGEYVYKRTVGDGYMEHYIVVEKDGAEICATLVGPFWKVEVPVDLRIEGVNKYDILSFGE